MTIKIDRGAQTVPLEIVEMRATASEKDAFRRKAFLIKDWLLSASQVLEGPHKGAVIGGVNEEGSPNYVYGEITGYFLTFLANVENSRTQLERYATSAINWIGDQYSDVRTPETRIYFNEGTADWRNQLIFSFDLAMILRGLSLASDANLADRVKCNSIATAVGKKLLRFIAPDGLLLPWIPRGAACDPPEARWSTTQGPFQLKTSAAILSANVDGLPSELQTAARATFDRWRDHPLDYRLVEEGHPLFYSLEGLTIAALASNNVQELDHVANFFRTILRDAFPRTGKAEFLSEIRSDVLSQFLRLGCILRNAGVLAAEPWDSYARVLADRLLQFMAPDNAVYFLTHDVAGSRNKNTWSSMFACQALHFVSLPDEMGAPAPFGFVI